MVTLAFVFLCPMPYYIDAPGGLTSLNDKVKMENKSLSGSYNLTYVSEYKASIPMLFYSLFNKDYDIYKKSDILLENETDKQYYKRDRLFLEESISNAVVAAYSLANKKVEIKSNYLYVGYILNGSNTDLEIGDKIISIDSKNVLTKKDVKNILKEKKVGDKLIIEVINGKKKYQRSAIVINDNGDNIIGIVPIEVYDYDTFDNIEIKMNKNESGSSGGLMLALTIYDLLSDDDIAKGRVIAGTGTIDSDYNVGEIGGIEYKIKGAVKNKVSVFFVPEANYKEALKIVRKNKYKIKLVKVKTLKEAIDYLKNN